MEKVFLSYAHQDNDVPEEWVNTFFNDLNLYTKVYSGKRHLEIWKDGISREKRDESIEEEIKKGLREAEMLIALVSPSYVQSWWGAFEREYFQRFVLNETKKNRILNVIKLNISTEEVNRLSRDLKVNFTYNFCKDIEGNQVTIKKGDPDYEKTIIALATSIASKLKENHSTRTVRIFVAKTTEDLLLDINRMISELESFKETKIEIATVGNFGEDETEQRQQIREIIQDCDFAIHFFGWGNGYKTSQFQWETVIDHLATNSLKTKVVTWMPSTIIEKIVGTENDYNEFLRANVMKLDASFHDFIINSFEDFLINMKEKIRSK